jgi:hypothetical protein
MKTLVLLAAGFAWSQDLSPDPRWSNLQPVRVQAMTFSAKNEMFIFGQFAAPYQGPAFSMVAKWMKRGWEFLPTNPLRTAHAMAFDKHGTLFVAGEYDSVTHGLASWNGTAWHPVALDSFGRVNALASDKEGNVYAAGTFMSIDGKKMSALAKWDGSAWSSLGWITELRIEINKLAVDEKTGAVYLNVESGSGGIYRWTATAGLKYLGSMWRVHAMSVSPAGKLFVFGDIIIQGGHVSTLCYIFGDSGYTTVNKFADDDHANALYADSTGGFLATGSFAVTYKSSATTAYWDGASLQKNVLASDWDPTWSGSAEQFIKSPSGDVFGYGYGLFQLKGKRVIPFGAPNALEHVIVDDNDVAYFWNRGGVESWDGFSQRLVATSPIGDITHLAFGKKGEIFAASDSAYAKRFINKWNGKEWIALPLNAYASINDMKTDRNGILHYSDGGRVFKWADTGWVGLPGYLFGTARENMLAFDNENKIYRVSGTVYVGNDTGWVKAPFLQGDTTIVHAYDVWFDHNNSAYVVGRETKWEMKIWKWDGQALTVIGTFQSSSINDFDANWIYAHAFDSKNNLYVGGNFYAVGGGGSSVSAVDFAKWDGKAWSNAGSGIRDINGSSVDCIAVDAEDYVFISGIFEVAGDKSNFRFAIYDGSDRPLAARQVNAPVKRFLGAGTRFTQHGFYVLKPNGPATPSVYLLNGRRVAMPR